ncbi:MAG: hypothetical protein M1831_006987 [Alyxoria varia]|nr:MAG: hypothetical protein M1831_006987 [Alyxoria varia]
MASTSLFKASNASNDQPKGTKRYLQPSFIAELHHVTPQENQSSIDQKKLKTIHDCLARTEQNGATRAEAETASRVAARLMTQYNVTNEDVKKYNDGCSTSEEVGGSAGVVIKPSPGSKIRTTNIRHWHNGLASAMTTFFDCQVYSAATRAEGNRKVSYRWVFYGLKANSEIAARGFMVVFNLISGWSMKKKGPKKDYLYGIAVGLQRIAGEEKLREERLAKEREEREKQEKKAAEHDQQKEEARLREVLFTRIGRAHQAQPVEPVPRKSPSNREHVVVVKREESLAQSSVHSRYPSVKPEPDDDAFPNYEEDDDEEMEDEIEPGVIEDEVIHIDESENVDDILERELQNAKTSGANDNDDIDTSGHSDMEDDNSEEEPETELINPIAGSREGPSTFNGQYGNARPSSQAQDNDLGSHEVSPWENQMQLMEFRKTAQQVAEEYEKGLKLRKGRKHRARIHDWKIYREGKEDSKRIDVKGNRIQQGAQHDSEMMHSKDYEGLVHTGINRPDI